MSKRHTDFYRSDEDGIVKPGISAVAYIHPQSISCGQIDEIRSRGTVDRSNLLPTSSVFPTHRD